MTFVDSEGKKRQHSMWAPWEIEQRLFHTFIQDEFIQWEDLQNTLWQTCQHNSQ